LPSSCLPSVHMCQLGLHWTDFREIWYWSLLLKSVEQNYVWLKSYKNVGHFKWRPKCIIIVVEILLARQQYEITHCWISMAAVSMLVLLTWHALLLSFDCVLLSSINPYPANVEKMVSS
jgi:hypothetical protein